MRFALLLALLSASAFGQGLPVKSGSSTNLGEVNASKQFYVTTATDGGVLGPIAVAGPQGNIASVRASATGVSRLVAGLDELLWYHPCEGTNVDSNLLEGTNVTFSAAQALATGITLNNGAVTTANSNIRLSSVRKFAYANDKPIVARWNFQRPVGQTGQLNETVEMGFFNAAAATAPTDGSFFRWSSAGTFVAINAFNSTEVSSATLTSPTANAWHTATIVLRQRDAEFFIDDVSVATVTASTSDPGVLSTQRISISWRVVIGAGSPGTAPQLRFAKAAVFEEGAGNRDKEVTLVQYGRGAYQSPVSTFVQTANHANSTSPTSATLLNTAAGYTTLGGRYQFAAVGAAATDFALFGYQVPTGYTLNITNVRISACNTVVTVATTPTVLDWGVGVNASAVSLATVEVPGPPATAWATRRIPLGMQGFVVGDLAGKCVPDVIRDFAVPLVVDSGRFFHVILQVPIGTATATEIFRGDVTVTGWFE